MKISPALTVALSLLAAPLAFAGDVDPASLYEVTTEGSTGALKAGEKGTFVLAIQVKEGAYVSNEAPLKLQLSGKNVTPEKSKLTYKDHVAKVAEGQKQPNPRFEVPIKAEAAGTGAVDAKLTFFICTEKICARQQKELSVPVQVN